MEKNNELIYWMCGHCKNVHSSDPKIRHQMQVCECGQSGVDAEEYYSRFIGNPIVITKEEYDNNKLYYCRGCGKKVNSNTCYGDQEQDCNLIDIKEWEATKK